MFALVSWRILRSGNKITVDQEKYFENVLNQFNMSDCKPVATPPIVNLELLKNDDQKQLVDERIHRSFVGSFFRLENKTRPDILNVVNQHSVFLYKPDNSHWKTAKCFFEIFERNYQPKINIR